MITTTSQPSPPPHNHHHHLTTITTTSQPSPPPHNHHHHHLTTTTTSQPPPPPPHNHHHHHLTTITELKPSIPHTHYNHPYSGGFIFSPVLQSPDHVLQLSQQLNPALGAFMGHTICGWVYICCYVLSRYQNHTTDYNMKSDALYSDWLVVILSASEFILQGSIT